jgi:hypothetical protein
MLAAARTPPALCSILRREITCLGVLLMAEHCRSVWSLGFSLWTLGLTRAQSLETEDTGADGSILVPARGKNRWACRHPQFGRQECLQDLTPRLGLLDARKQGGQSHLRVVLCELDAANGNSVRGSRRGGLIRRT